MGKEQQKTSRKKTTSLERLAEAAPPRPKTRYSFGLTPAAVPSPEPAALPPQDEHSSFVEHPPVVPAHEQSSSGEQQTSRYPEQTLSTHGEQGSGVRSPIFTEDKVHAFLAENNISPHFVQVFAFIDHIAANHPGVKIGRVVYQAFIKGPSYITIRRALEFWEKTMAIQVEARSSMGTAWKVDPVFSKVMKGIFKFPPFPPFNQHDFLRGKKYSKSVTQWSKRHEQGSTASLDRENINPSVSYKVQEEDIPDCWPHLYSAGFRINHLRQIEQAFEAQALDKTNIPMFMRFIEFELENGVCTDARGNAVEKPVSWFLVCMKKGTYRIPDGYEDPRAYAERMRLKELRDNLERECELKFLEDRDRVERMKGLVERLQNELAENGVRSPNFVIAKEYCGSAGAMINQQGNAAWKHTLVGAALRSACLKGLIAIEDVNSRPVIRPLKEAAAKL